MEQEQLELLMGNVQHDDVVQEIALLKLEGVQRPSYRIVKQRLQSQNRELFFSPEASIDQVYSIESPWEQSTSISYEAIELVMEWAEQNAPETIQNQVAEYLSSPTDELLVELLGALSSAGLIAKQKAHKTPRGTLTDVLKRALAMPQPLEELYELARRVSPTSPRPEASVRTIIRRLLQQGEIIEVSNRIYSIA